MQRTHDQITRSETRSASPGPVTKRRRLQRTPANNPSPTPRPARFSGDGFDYRRPVMADGNQNSGFIDLTGDDEVDDNSDEPQQWEAAQFFDVPHIPPSDDEDDDYFVPSARQSPARARQPALVIDLSDDEDDNEPGQNRPSPPRRASTSPDVVFLAERAVTPPPPRPQPRRPSIRSRRPTPGPHVIRNPPVLGAPPPMPGLGLQDMIRRGTQMILGYAPPFLQQGGNARAANAGVDLDLDDDLEFLEMDYAQPAFNLGNRDTETPQATPGEAYKEPPPIPEGFAGDVEEDGVYVCPRCEDEIATGSDEKQQLWVVKQCGHVSCVSRRCFPLY